MLSGCGCLQVPRILNPLVLVLDSLPALCRDPKLAAYVQSVWGGVEQCRRASKLTHPLFAVPEADLLSKATCSLSGEGLTCPGTPKLYGSRMYYFLNLLRPREALIGSPAEG